MFVLLNDVRFCAFVIFVYVARVFSKACALVSSEFYWGLWLGYGWMVSYLHFFDHFRYLFGLFICLNW